MTVIYMTSVSKGAGKTMIAAGLGRQLRKDGKKVGFLKLAMANNSQPATDNDSDALFIQKALGLGEVATVHCPSSGKESHLAARIKEALAQVGQNKDVVLIEGLPYAESDDIIKTLDARVLLINEYHSQLPADISKKPGKNLLGVVVNKVPARYLTKAAAEFTATPGNTGINLLGVIPEDRILTAMTVSELASNLEGTILNTPDRINELVESFMIGAMTIDSGPLYFNRKDNKAVLVRGERPDMQMAALQTSTRCLVISGGIEPLPAVRLQAESKKVPLISVKSNTSASIAALEESFRNTKFNQEKKLARLDEIMGKQFNYQALYTALGLAK